MKVVVKRSDSAKLVGPSPVGRRCRVAADEGQASLVETGPSSVPFASLWVHLLPTGEGPNFLLCFCFVLTALLLPAPLVAQTNPDGYNAAINVNPYRLDPSPAGAFSFGATQPLGHFELGLAVTGQTLEQPIVVRYGSGGPTIRSLVDSRWQLDFAAAAGFFDYLEVGINLPTIVNQTGEYPGLGLGATASFGLADPVFQIRGRVIPREWSALGLTIALPITLPLGDETAYMGVDGFTVEPRLEVSGHFSRTTLILAAGYLAQPRNEVFTLTDDDKITLRLGVVELTQVEGLEAAVELIGHTLAGAPFENFEELRTEAVFGLRYRFFERYSLHGGAGIGIIRGVPTPILRTFLGFGVRFDFSGEGVPGSSPEYPETDTDLDGLVDSVDSCVAEAEDADGFEDEDGCPDGAVEDEDNDGDGLVNTADDCPEEAEDVDDFEDEDGCPDTDNDGDGIDDSTDLCPDEPEDMDGFDDDDGCSEPESHIELEGQAIVIDEPIEFNFGDDIILPTSYPTLDAILQLLQQNQNLEVQIRGHTDNVGSADANLRLSQQRADAVRRYLIRRSNPEDDLEHRLDAIGLGETTPIADDSTQEGQSRNRRVDFIVIDQ